MLFRSITFEKGSKLKAFTGGHDNNYKILGAFLDCKSLTTIEIPASVETVSYTHLKCAYILSSVWTCVKETLHTEEYKRFNTQRANELQGINKKGSMTWAEAANSATMSPARAIRLASMLLPHS